MITTDIIKMTTVMITMPVSTQEQQKSPITMSMKTVMGLFLPLMMTKMVIAPM